MSNLRTKVPLSPDPERPTAMIVKTVASLVALMFAWAIGLRILLKTMHVIERLLP